MPKSLPLQHFLARALILLSILLFTVSVIDAAGSISRSSDNEDLEWTPMVLNSTNTVSYQIIAQTTLEPRIPRSIIYYTQDHGHRYYDTTFEPNGSIKQSAYMGFELLNAKQFQFNYHVELPSDIQSYPNEIKNMALEFSTKLDSECGSFDGLLDYDSSAEIKSCYTNVTMIPLLSSCSPSPQFNPVTNQTETVYPCGAGSCQKCSSMRGCVGDRDCIWGTSCLENICGMIANASTNPFTLTLLFSTLMLSLTALFSTTGL